MLKFSKLTLLTSKATPAPVVASLKKILNEDPKMERALVPSLNIAVRRAKLKLDPELYKAIDKEFQGKGWPTTTKHYLEYIDLYLKFIPNESNDPEYPYVWKSNRQQNGYNRKVFDLLVQSYWLIDQKIPATNMTMQSFPKFANC